MNMLAWDAIVAAAKELGNPTQGEFATSLWILCSGHYGLNVADATRLYRACGYVPFAGYPLTVAQEQEQKRAA
jgi:hypothetical protein